MRFTFSLTTISLFQTYSQRKNYDNLFYVIVSCVKVTFISSELCKFVTHTSHTNLQTSTGGDINNNKNVNPEELVKEISQTSEPVAPYSWI